jgi:hypothetical protein
LTHARARLFAPRIWSNARTGVTDKGSLRRKIAVPCHQFISPFNAPSLMALIDWRDDPRAARTDPRLHPDQARWHAREPRLKLAAPPLLTQNDCCAPAHPVAFGEKQTSNGERNHSCHRQRACIATHHLSHKCDYVTFALDHKRVKRLTPLRHRITFATRRAWRRYPAPGFGAAVRTEQSYSQTASRLGALGCTPGPDALVGTRRPGARMCAAE